jgi:hypothetical protein
MPTMVTDIGESMAAKPLCQRLAPTGSNMSSRALAFLLVPQPSLNQLMVVDSAKLREDSTLHPFHSLTTIRRLAFVEAV